MEPKKILLTGYFDNFDPRVTAQKSDGLARRRHENEKTVLCDSVKTGIEKLLELAPSESYKLTHMNVSYIDEVAL